MPSVGIGLEFALLHWQEYTDIHQEHVMDRQLLQFAEEGIMRKQGIMGDDGVSSKDEL